MIARPAITCAAAALLAVTDVAVASSWALSAETWARPRSGRAVASMAPVAEAVQAWSRTREDEIVVLYAGGESGTLWAAELRDWMVALGVPSDHVRLTAGGEPGRLRIELR